LPFFSTFTSVAIAIRRELVQQLDPAGTYGDKHV